MMKKYTENGIDSFEQHEVLEILLFNIFTRCNTNDISHRLLNEFKTIKGVLNADISELTAIKGVGENAAARICFWGDFLRYIALEPAETTVLPTNGHVFNYCKDIADISSREFFMILFLDKKQTLVSNYFVKGHFNFAAAVRRDIAAKAIAPGSTGAVAIHNHFENEIVPSSADVVATRNLRNFLNSLNVDLYDHLIINTEKYFSMRSCDTCRKIWTLSD